MIMAIVEASLIVDVMENIVSMLTSSRFISTWFFDKVGFITFVCLALELWVAIYRIS